MSETKFTGIWIPAEVVQLDTLTITEKLTYGIISALDNEEGCYASNGYLATTLKLSERQVKNVIKTLIDYNLVKRVESDGKRILRTIEKQALMGAIDYPAQGNVLPTRRKSISRKGGNVFPTDSIVDNKDDNKVILPYGESFKEAWTKWVAYRKQIKKPMGAYTQQEQLIMLGSWNDEEKSIQSINYSIANGWVGLFTVSKDKSKTLTNKDHQNGF